MMEHKADKSISKYKKLTMTEHKTHEHYKIQKADPDGIQNIHEYY